MGSRYGKVIARRLEDGSIVVDRADPVIGVSVELLSRSENGVRVTSDGWLSFGSDGLTLYRPVRFDPAHSTRVLICERVVGNG